MAAAISPDPTRTTPRAPPMSLHPVSTVWNRAQSGSLSRTSSRPAGVSAMARPSRRKRAVPRWLSSSRTRAEMAGCVVLSRAAAAAKVPSRAIHSSVSR